MAQEIIPWHRRLTSKFVAMALLFVLAPQVILYLFAVFTATDVLIESLREGLKEKVFLVGADIDRFFKQREIDVRILSQADVLEHSDINAIKKYLTEIIKETPFLNEIDVIDTDGIIIASSGDQNERGMDIRVRHPTLQKLFDEVQSAMQGEVFVSEILIFDGAPGLAFLTPITDDTNTIVVKTLLVEINLETVSKIVADFDARVIGDKYVYLVDNQGRVIISADPETSLLSPFPDLSVQPELLVHFSQQGEVGSVIYEDTNETLVMAGFADMAEFGVNEAMDWSIIAVAPIADITMPVDRFKMTMLIFMIIVSGMGVFFMFLMSRNIVASVLNLVDGSRRVGSGDLKFRVDPGATDEFGFLARTLNQTLDNLVSANEDAEREITERKRTEVELSRHKDQLEEIVMERTKELNEAQEQLIRKEKLAVLGQLAGGVGHELRNPLGAIKNAAYFLNMALEKPEPEIIEALEILNAEVASSVRIIESLLNFARPQPPTRQKVDIKDVVQRVLDRSEIPETIDTVIHLDEAQAPILTDPDQLSLIFGNIILNAIQAMPDGGLLEVKSEVPASGWIAVSFSDTGAGIPEENLAKIFDPLFTTKAKGMGLGLALTMTLVKGLGGTIEVSSEAGKGSTFKVRLPEKNKGQGNHG